MKSEKLILLFLGYFSASLMAVIGIPYLDKLINPQSTTPGAITFVGVGMILSLITAFAIYLGLNAITGTKKQLLVYTAIYSTLIIAVKFSLAAAGVYILNQDVTFNGGFGSIFGSGTADPFFLLLSGVIIFFMYAFVFMILGGICRKRLIHTLEPQVDPLQKSHEPFLTRHKKKLIVLGSMSLLVGFLFVIGWIQVILTPFLIGYLAFWGSFQYASYALTSVFGILIGLALVAAVFFVNSALESAKDQAIVMRDVSILVTFLWIGIIFLFAFHALWIVYFLIITSIWPLRVVVPK